MSASSEYTKKIISIDQQISQLKERGLIISDEDSAKKYLKNISYFRLQGFWWEFQDATNGHKFDDGTTFEKVIQLYTFDRKLRLLLFDAIERIEIAVRTKLVYYPSIELGQWWFEHVGNFLNPDHFDETIEEIDKELRRTKEVFIKSHYEKYGDEHRPPSFKTLEVISFGCLSKLYRNLNANDGVKKRIAKELNLPNYLYLQSWLKTFNVIRNIIAHHSRIWNRSIDFPPRILHKTDHAFISEPKDENSMYHCMSCILFVLNKVSEGHSIKDKIVDLIRDADFIDPAEMGFPKEWQSQPIWS